MNPTYSQIKLSHAGALQLIHFALQFEQSEIAGGQEFVTDEAGS